MLIDNLPYELESLLFFTLFLYPYKFAALRNMNNFKGDSTTTPTRENMTIS